MKPQKLPKRTLWLWQLRCIAFYFVIIALCAYFYASHSFLLIAGAVITVVCLASVFWYLPFYIGSYQIICSGEGVVIKRGVIIKTTHIMPYSKLIYTQTFTTPVAKLLGLTAVSLKAARAVVFIPEMRLSDAKHFLAFLSSGDKDE